MASIKEITGIDHAIKFQCPAALALIGVSRSGKSEIIHRLLIERARLFEAPPDEIIYVYEHWSPQMSALKDKISWIEFRQDIPTKAEFEDFSKDNFSRFLVIDDKAHTLRKNPDIDYISTVGCSHSNISVILSSQFFLAHSPELKTYVNNCTSIILTRSRRAESQISELGRQIFGSTRKKWFLDAYRQATFNKPYSYLVLDMSQNLDEKYQLRTQIFENENCLVFTEKKT